MRRRLRLKKPIKKQFVKIKPFQESARQKFLGGVPKFLEGAENP